MGGCQSISIFFQDPIQKNPQKLISEVKAFWFQKRRLFPKIFSTDARSPRNLKIGTLSNPTVQHTKMVPGMWGSFWGVIKRFFTVQNAGLSPLSKRWILFGIHPPVRNRPNQRQMASIARALDLGSRSLIVGLGGAESAPHPPVLEFSSNQTVPKIKPQLLFQPQLQTLFLNQNQSQSFNSKGNAYRKKEKKSGKVLYPRRGQGKDQTYWKYLKLFLVEKKSTSKAPQVRKVTGAITRGPWVTRERYLQPNPLLKVPLTN